MARKRWNGRRVGLTSLQPPAARLFITKGLSVHIRHLGMLIVLAALWGASFLFIRVAAPVLGPFLLVVVRVLLASGVLWLYALLMKHHITMDGRWRQFVLLGTLNAAMPFTLIAIAELQLTASLAAILNATTPLFAALVAAVWINDALTLKQSFGLLLGLCGVTIVVGWSPLPLTVPVLLSVGASLTAAFFYGLGGVYAKVTFAGTSPLTMATLQQLWAGVVVLPLVVVAPPQQVPSFGIVLAVLVLAILCTALAYLLYFRLLTEVGPTSTLSVTFLVPVFGVFWSALFLQEALRAGQFVGLGIILVSLVLVTGVRIGWLRARPEYS
ncbi:MAG: DMT family transporter [Chloroflexi bacterium AL-W]|nr:DMT family transporter [Chloroflexi bacterium AL-N1]NOK70104.1 DMT family transporter [Chloroflexi bacterium AL-N10]NOK77884.1 DMT family transporter [Chloroflexi bacterium AL-N5]NOK84893.1 DMT family transporter [Chloroflexi bacterium AL-W]NOK91872.1 DMT family transporter [Chloroflexi bacterium AL-N15]